MSPPLMKAFLPFSFQTFPTFSAFVWIPATSLPATASVVAWAPFFSPFATGTTYLFFCSSLPKSSIGFTNSPFTPTNAVNAGQTLATSSENIELLPGFHPVLHTLWEPLILEILVQPFFLADLQVLGRFPL